MPKKPIIRRIILAILGFLIILFERIIAELSPAGESTESHIFKKKKRISNNLKSNTIVLLHEVFEK